MTPLIIRIFGSRAKESHRPDSDIDVLIEGSDAEIEKVKVLLKDWSVEQGGPLDLFVISSVDNEIDLVAAYCTDQSRVVGVGDEEDLDDLMDGAQTVTLKSLTELCVAVDADWGQTTLHEKLQRKTIRP